MPDLHFATRKGQVSLQREMPQAENDPKSVYLQVLRRSSATYGHVGGAQMQAIRLASDICARIAGGLLVDRGTAYDGTRYLRYHLRYWLDSGQCASIASRNVPKCHVTPEVYHETGYVKNKTWKESPFVIIDEAAAWRSSQQWQGGRHLSATQNRRRWRFDHA